MISRYVKTERIINDPSKSSCVDSKGGHTFRSTRFDDFASYLLDYLWIISTAYFDSSSYIACIYRSDPSSSFLILRVSPILTGIERHHLRRQVRMVGTWLEKRTADQIIYISFVRYNMGIRAHREERITRSKCDRRSNDRRSRFDLQESFFSSRFRPLTRPPINC